MSLNIAVINLKDIFRNLVMLTVLICLVIIVTRFFSGINFNNGQKIIQEKINVKTKQISTYTYTECLGMALPIMNYSKDRSEETKIVSSSTILNLELGILDNKLIEENDTDEIKRNVVSSKPAEEEEEINLSGKVNLETSNERNISETSNVNYGKVKIQNDSDFKLTKEMLKPNIKITNKKDIFIYHAHTCESYTPSEKYQYKMTGNYRTTDLNYSVARVGKELKKYLEKRGFKVKHDTTYHDYPSYSGSYDKAAKTAREHVTGTDTQLVIDLHRDAVRKRKYIWAYC